MTIEFQPFVEADLRLFHGWLGREHVRRWWQPEQTYEEIVAEYLPAIEGTDPTDVYLIVIDRRRVGFIQTYLLSDYPEHAALIGVGAGVAGVDLLIAEEELTGQGLGTEVLRAFVREIVFARPGTTACVADPDVRNAASLRAFEKAGFRPVGEFVDPEDGQNHRLVRLDAR